MQSKLKEFIDNIKNYDFFEKLIEQEVEKLINTGFSDFMIMRLYHSGCSLIDVLRHKYTRKAYIKGLGSYSNDVYEEDRVFQINKDDIVTMINRAYKEDILKFDKKEDKMLGIKARAIYNILNTVAYLPFDKNTTVNLILCIIRGFLNESEYTEKRICEKVHINGW